MNAIDFLLKEHMHVRKILDQINEKSKKYETKREIFQTLCHDLLRHESMEHTVWYPHFKNDIKLNEKVKHLLSEEKTAEKILKQFDTIQDEKEWENKFSKLKKDVEHHAQEEEVNLFPEVKKLLTNETLEKIGVEMFNFKKNYESSTL